MVACDLYFKWICFYVRSSLVNIFFILSYYITHYVLYCETIKEKKAQKSLIYQKKLHITYSWSCKET
jgi:hypothetical protein